MLLDLRKTFARDDRGSMAPMLAVSIVVLMCAAGAAIDFGNIQLVKTHAQAVVDSAALSAAASMADASGSQAAAQAVISAQLPALTVSAFTQDASGSATVEGQISVQTPFMTLVGLGKQLVTVRATASRPDPVLSQLQINVENAYGWSDKDLRVNVRRHDGTVETVLTAHYHTTDRAGANNRGTGVTTFAPASSVTLGEFDDLWLELEVYPYDGGSTFVYASNQAHGADHVWIEGHQASGPINYKSLISCTAPVRHAWEDSNLVGEWRDQDVYFRIEGTCDTSNANGNVRLTN